MRRLFLAATIAITASLTQAQAADTLTAFSVIDQRGKQISFPAPAERLVVIPIPMASVVIALDGSSRRLAAIHPVAVKSVTDGFLGRVFPEAALIPSDIVAGGRFNPNLESILALRPDAIVQWTYPTSIIEPLETAGLTVVGLQNDPQNQTLNERNLTILATVIGQTDRLKQVLDMHHDRLAEIRRQAEAIPADQKKRALYLRMPNKGFRANGTHSYRDFWIPLAGARNIPAEEGLKGLPSVTVEQIVAWNPEVIFLGAFDKGTPEQIYSNPVFAGIEAVKNRRVYKVPHGGYRWDPASHESHLAWTWAAMVLHPEVFSFDLRSDMRKAYQFFYGHALTNAEIDAILQTSLNTGSAGYNVFRP